ncbi:unnamed protein product [Candida verbasci]|uniref:tRNA wybutosine-synthesizing protein 2 n=1 Tax=Candida verbasci TaxID=1227364 RepID=A0A9W4XGP7_9ASCO|nr:unnamed protein product [Candida verbasci]
MFIKLIIKDPKEIKTIKSRLENEGLLNKRYKIENKNGVFSIYTKLETLPCAYQSFNYEEYEEIKTTKITLESIIRSYNIKTGLCLEIPKRWSIYPPMILFNAFKELTFPKDLCIEILSHQSTIFGVTGLSHIAVNQPIIESDILRRPHNLKPMYGNFGPDLESDHIPTSIDFQEAFWCYVIQNGIYQTWAPKYTMFSRGNIKEKSRILQSFKNLNNSIIFDLYCGIGYFSLSYLKNGGKLLCWEMNPWSIEGFRRSLETGNYKYRIYSPNDVFEIKDLNDVDVCIFYESNDNVPIRLQNVNDISLNVSHVNLGLLPSSKASWSLTKNLMNKAKTSSTIHIHENCHIDDFDKLKQEIIDYFKPNCEILQLEKVKTFAPDIWHIVIDVKLNNALNKI